MLSEGKDRTRLGLSKYAAEAAERAGESDGDLALSRDVRDVAAVHSTLWREDHNDRGILNMAVLTGQVRPRPIPLVKEGLFRRFGHANGLETQTLIPSAPSLLAGSIGLRVLNQIRG
jgi:hypothetical protein